MKTMNAKLGVGGLIACLLFTGCDSMSKPTKLPKMSNQTVLVVPVQGEPVGVVSHHLGVSVLGGVVGTSLEQAAAGSVREELAERLNRDAADFTPDVMLAEECAHLLKYSPLPAFRSAILQTESVLLPEEKELLLSESRPFKGRQTNMMKWLSLYNKWRKGPPLAVNLQQNKPDSGVLGLEVRFQRIQINHGNELDTAALVRLVDHESRRVIGAAYVGHESYNIRPVTIDTDPAAFTEDFRRLASQLAKEALTKMKLL